MEINDEHWDEVKCFCPHCGARDTWAERARDYYVGSRYICVKCLSLFYLPHGISSLNEDERAIAYTITTSSQSKTR